MFITVTVVNSQPDIHLSTVFSHFLISQCALSEGVRSQWAKLNNLVEVHLVIRYFTHPSFPKLHFTRLKTSRHSQSWLNHRLPLWSKSFLHSLPTGTLLRMSRLLNNENCYVSPYKIQGTSRHVGSDPS